MATAGTHHLTRRTGGAQAGGSPGNRIEALAKRDRGDIVTIIGRIASVLSVIMYVSYVTQIANNLGGHSGSPWQPLAAFFNCVMWTAYGLLKPQRDWPIVVANVPGIFLAAATFATALM